jgi:hypothetical protein
VHVGGTKDPLHLRLVGLHTPKGYSFFLTNLPLWIGPRQVADPYRTRWAVEISQPYYDSREHLSPAAA